MHAYTNDWPWKAHLHYALGVISGSIASLLGYLASLVASWTGIPVSGLSALVVYIALFCLIDRWLWRFKHIRHFMIIPNLNGKWKTDGHTVRKNGDEVSIVWNNTLTITQSWTKIQIQSSGGASESKSVIASIEREANGAFLLRYLYRNTPKLGSADGDMQAHYGFARVLISPDGSEGAGSYFTDEGRTTAGTIEINKE
ncbi:MAG: hypothetical protein AAF086_03510 [Planctomycetota bacterium]